MKDAESEIKDVESGVHAVPPGRTGTNSSVENVVDERFDIGQVSLERIDQVYRYVLLLELLRSCRLTASLRKLDLRIIPGSQASSPPCWHARSLR